MFAQSKQLLSRRFWQLARLCIIGMCLALVIALPRFPAVAQSIRRATVVEILDNRLVFIQGKRAKLKDSGSLREQIQTASRSRASLQFNVPAGVRLDQNSSMIVGDECIRLFKGKVLVTGNTGKLGCVGKIRALPKGTVYVMEVGDGNEQGQIAVLEGEVEIFNEDAPNVKLATLSAGQQVQTTAGGTVEPPQTLTQSQLQTIAAPLFDDFQVPLPGLERVAIVRPRQGFTATFLGEALTGGDAGFEDFDGQKDQPSFVIRGVSADGIFTRNAAPNDNTGTFTPATTLTLPGGQTIPAGTSIPITVDFDARTIVFNGVPLQTVTSSLGLSGNGAAGTVVYQNGQAIRLEVVNVGVGKEPPPGSSFPGRITGGLAPDR